MVLLVIIIRFLFVAPLLITLRRRQARQELAQTQFREMLDRVRSRLDLPPNVLRRRQRAERMYHRRQVDIEQLRDEGFSWKGGLVLSWSGMRGVVTLAAAQSLPEEMDYRPQLILIAFTVAVVTLLLQGGTLPWLIRATGIRGTDRAADRRELATLLDEMGTAALAVLDSPQFTLPDGEQIDSATIERVRHDTKLSAESARERAEHGAGVDALVHSPQRQYRELRREVLRAERDALLEARSTGTYPSRILARAQTMLDLEETRLEQIDNPSGT